MAVVVISRASHLLTLITKQISLPLLFSTSSSDLSLIISEVVSILKEQRSKSRWNYIKTLVNPNGFTSKQVSEITLGIKNNPRLALRFFHWSQKNSLCKHDLVSYSTIIHILARARLKTSSQTLMRTVIRVYDPLEVFETLVKSYRYCDSAPFVFDLLVKVCLLGNKIDCAIEIVRMLRSRGISMNITTCNMLIRCVFKLRGCDACLVVYRQVFRDRIMPNVQTMNTLLLCFYQDGIMERVEEIWDEMCKHSMCCRPNVYSYSVLLAAFCDQGKMGEAMRLWDEMRVKEVKPDVMAYNTLIKGLCENREMERAEDFFRQMEMDRIEATCLTFEHLIRGYCEAGDVESAMLLYRNMCRTKEFRPEVFTVEEVIRAMCGKNKIFDALKFFRDTVKRHGLCPSGRSYEFLIRGLCEEGKMEDALKLQTEMVGKGFEPSVEIYNCFISGYSRQGNEELSRNLRKEMVDFGLKQEGDEQDELTNQATHPCQSESLSQ
ncbi:hypothetical protein IFM89_010932 [Coptis chinensis]|uniref:Pentatricopeptide repeat-containing protein n=1 Tax=Coptis chinensis TaxID=261450 RepID=A0A835M8E1_9MAGN|nr:hypothetical protein IFM89_010932 [Coptis chinensis]